MNPAPTLRELAWPDIALLAELEPVLFPDDAWSAATWWGELALRPRRQYVVAELGGQLLGYAGLDAAGETADVMTIAVVPQARRSGIGEALLHWLTHQAVASGAAYLMLEVREDNLSARALYERNGFQLLRVRRRYYQPGDVDAFVLRRALP
ncbi:MAG TPA: ribosomal protein S18-alanine N-acetyltransferase [Dermatophilaceae bacterium]|nr:ribosomal protein S18-alanine N-acetyltransferase [Dermatophilaceae bacterium]